MKLAVTSAVPNSGSTVLMLAPAVMSRFAITCLCAKNARAFGWPTIVSGCPISGSAPSSSKRFTSDNVVLEAAYESGVILHRFFLFTSDPAWSRYLIVSVSFHSIAVKRAVSPLTFSAFT